MVAIHNLLPSIGALSLLVAAAGLWVSASSAAATRRASEATTILDIWSRFEGYVSSLGGIKETRILSEARIPFLNLANFIENICYLYNKKAAPKPVRDSIFSLVADFVAAWDRVWGISYSDALTAFSTHPKTFVETKSFIRRHASKIKRRADAMSEITYGPFRNLDPAP